MLSVLRIFIFSKGDFEFAGIFVGCKMRDLNRWSLQCSWWVVFFQSSNICKCSSSGDLDCARGPAFQQQMLVLEGWSSVSAPRISFCIGLNYLISRLRVKIYHIPSPFGMNCLTFVFLAVCLCVKIQMCSRVPGIDFQKNPNLTLMFSGLLVALMGPAWLGELSGRLQLLTLCLGHNCHPLQKKYLKGKRWEAGAI